MTDDFMKGIPYFFPKTISNASIAGQVPSKRLAELAPKHPMDFDVFHAVSYVLREPCFSISSSRV